MFWWKILSDLNFLQILNVFLLSLIAQSNNLVHGIVQIGNCSDGSPAVLPCDQESKICTGNPQMGCERHGPAYFCCGKLPSNGNDTAKLMQSPSMPAFSNLPSDGQNSQQNCDDKFKQCEHWTRRGLCLMDMYKSETKAKLCPKSCKLCHLVPPKDVGPEPNGQGAQGQPQIHPDPPKPSPANTVNANPNSNIDPPNTLIKGKIAGVSPIKLPQNGTDLNGNIIPKIPNGNSPYLTNPTTMPVPPPTTTPAQGFLDSIRNNLAGRNASESDKGNPESSTMPSLTSTNGQMRTTTEKSNTVDPSWYDGFDMDEVKKIAEGEWDEMDTERLGQKFDDKMASTMSTEKSASTTANLPTVDPSWYDGFDMDEVKKMADGGWDEMDTERLGRKLTNKNSNTPNSMPSTSMQMSTMPSSPLINASNLDVNSPGLFETIWDKLIGKNLSENANLTSTPPPLTTMDPAFYEDDGDERLNGKHWDWEKNQNDTNNSTEKPANSTIRPNSTSPFPLLPSKIGGKKEPKKPRKLSPEEGEFIHEKRLEEAKKKNMEEKAKGRKNDEDEEEERRRKEDEEKKNEEEKKKTGKKKDEEKERRRDEDEDERKKKNRRNRMEDEQKNRKNRIEDEEKRKSRRKNKVEDEEGNEEKRRDDNEDEGKRKRKGKNMVEDEEDEKEEEGRDEDEVIKKKRRRNKAEEDKEEYYNDEYYNDEEEDYSSGEDDYDYEGSYSMEDDEKEDERKNYWDEFRRGMHGIRDDVKKATIGKKNNKKVDWNEFKQKMHSLRG